MVSLWNPDTTSRSQRTDGVGVSLGQEGNKCYVAIKGKVYDVTGNKMYQPGNSYHGESRIQRQSGPSLCVPTLSWILTALAVFAGKDASRALGMTSTKAEDVSPEWKDLSDKEKGVLNDWIKFFSHRYNVVGVVEGATNFDDDDETAS